MKFYVILLVYVLLGLSAKGQDTLSCKSDLTWDSAEKYYYKIGDESKKGVTSPAKCFPCKTCENRGYLKNGKWDGMVFGYKNSKLIGRIYYEDNAEKGYSIDLNSNGIVTDSTVFDKSGYTYNLTRGFKKNNVDLEYISEYSYKNDTSIVKYYAKDEDVGEYVQLIRRFKGKQKHGIQEMYEVLIINGVSSVSLYETSEYVYGKLSGKVTQFEDGIKSTEYEYADGVKTKETWFDLSGNIEIVFSYKNGKRDGTATHYNPDGTVNYTEEYKSGKLKK